MGVLSEISAGLEIGVQTGNIIVRYSKAQYQEKISRLDGCVKKLDTHLSTMEALRDQFKQVWDDDVAMQYYEQIKVQIQAVKNAHEATNRQIDMWQEVIREMEESTANSAKSIEDIRSLIGALGIVF